MPRPRALLLALLAPLLGAAHCQPSKPPCDHKQSDVHYDLGIENQKNGDVRGSVREFEEAVRLCPDNYQAENYLGVLLHVSFRRMEESEQHYRRALEIKANYSEAKVNLGNLYQDQNRCDEAIKLYEEALRDMFYQKPFLAENNEGWCFYKKGETDKALGLIQEAVHTNPDFCMGYRNLGQIYAEKGNLPQARKEYDRLVKKCPDSAEAWYRLGKLQLQQGETGPAVQSFSKCRDLSKEGEPLLDECTTLAGGPK